MSKRPTTPKPSAPPVNQYRGPSGNVNDPAAQAAVQALADLRTRYGLPQPGRQG